MFQYTDDHDAGKVSNIVIVVSGMSLSSWRLKLSDLLVTTVASSMSETKSRAWRTTSFFICWP